MNRANPTPSPRRALAAAALIAALVGLAALLAQCRMVSNDVLGVGLQHGADQARACTAQCTKTYNDQIKQENDLHRANEAACNSDPACLAAEEARHDAELTRLNQAKQDCVNGCHTQGRGSAGN